MRYQLLMILSAGAVCSYAATVHAADVTWDPPSQFPGASQPFVLNGQLDRAYSFLTSGNLSIDGITLTPFDSNPNGDKTTLDGRYDQYRASGLAGDLGTFLTHGAFHDLDASSISFANLVPGGHYTVEVVASGKRDRTDCCSAGAGYTNLFVYNRPAGQVGSTVHWDDLDTTSRAIYGRFVADPSGNQSILFNLDATVIPGETTAPNPRRRAQPHSGAGTGVVGCWPSALFRWQSPGGVVHVLAAAGAETQAESPSGCVWTNSHKQNCNGFSRTIPGDPARSPLAV